MRPRGRRWEMAVRRGRRVVRKSWFGKDFTDLSSSVSGQFRDVDGLRCSVKPLNSPRRATKMSTSQSLRPASGVVDPQGCPPVGSPECETYGRTRETPDTAAKRNRNSDRHDATLGLQHRGVVTSSSGTGRYRQRFAFPSTASAIKTSAVTSRAKAPPCRSVTTITLIGFAGVNSQLGKRTCDFTALARPVLSCPPNREAYCLGSTASTR